MSSETVLTVIDIIYFVIVAVMTVYNLFRGKSIQKNISLLTEMTSKDNNAKISEEVRRQVKEFMEELFSETVIKEKDENFKNSIEGLKDYVKH